MPINRNCARQAARPAQSLQLLLQGNAMAQLLQQGPPRRPMSPQQQGLMTHLGSALEKLGTSLPNTDNECKASGQQLALRLLQHQAAYSVGVVARWAQQQPEQLTAAMQHGGAHPHTLGKLWSTGNELIQRICWVCGSSEPSALACSQQLETSGKRSSLQPAGSTTTKTLAIQSLVSLLIT
jgi:hypothetical protein